MNLQHKLNKIAVINLLLKSNRGETLNECYSTSMLDNEMCYRTFNRVAIKLQEQNLIKLEVSHIKIKAGRTTFITEIDKFNLEKEEKIINDEIQEKEKLKTSILQHKHS